MSALSQKKQTSNNRKTDTLRLIEKQKTLNSVLTQILEHAGLKCEHCKDLLEKVTSHHCDRCFKETDLLHLNKRYGSDFQLCDFCMEHD